jgi:hypothetical protein
VSFFRTASVDVLKDHCDAIRLTCTQHLAFDCGHFARLLQRKSSLWQLPVLGFLADCLEAVAFVSMCVLLSTFVCD